MAIPKKEQEKAVKKMRKSVIRVLWGAKDCIRIYNPGAISEIFDKEVVSLIEKAAAQDIEITILCHKNETEKLKVLLDKFTEKAILVNTEFPRHSYVYTHEGYAFFARYATYITVKFVNISALWLVKHFASAVKEAKTQPA